MQNKIQIEINCKTVKSFKKNTGKYRKNEKTIKKVWPSNSWKTNTKPQKFKYITKKYKKKNPKKTK